MRCRRLRVGSFVAGWLLMLGGAAYVWAGEAPVAAPRPDLADSADAAFRFGELTLARRREIDARALASPAPRTFAPNGPLFGDLAGWAVARTPLNRAEEARRAELAVAELKRRFTIGPAPEEAKDVLSSLVAELPERWRPARVRFTLHVIEVPEWTALTSGAGHVFVSRGYLDALLADRATGRARLAFVLAHELGHNAYGHCRRGYQLIALQEAARREALDEVDRERLRRLAALSVRKVGDWIAFLYTAEQDLEADLFALHLCRNAGYDAEACLDVLRLWTLRNGGSDPAVPDEDAAQREGGGESGAPGFAAAALRLRNLRYELDGTLDGAAYGLQRFDAAKRCFVSLDEREQVFLAGRRGVVFVHGMGSSLETFVPQAECLLEHDSQARLVLFGFQYPGDASLARVGRALARELAAFGDDAERLDFVCHSAGGLAFRWYAEIERGKFRRAVFEGTPHGGSDLARLRQFLEVQQVAGDLRLGFREAAEGTVLDGDGQIGHDVEPDSLFLRYLARGEREPGRYAIFRGRRLSDQRAVWMRSSAALLRSALRRAAPETVRLGPFRQETDRWIEQLEVPREILDGDLAVTVEHAGLESVTRIETVRASHYKLQRHPDVMEGVCEIVLSEDSHQPGARVRE